MHTMLVALVLMLAAGQQDPAPVPTPIWTTATPSGAGFAVEAPGELKVNPGKSTGYMVELPAGAFFIDVDALEPKLQQAMAAGNRAAITTYMETLRDLEVAGAHGERGTSSAADFSGYPSVAFTFTGTAGSGAFQSSQRIVVTGDRVYMVGVLGDVNALKKADIDRFVNSFRLTSAAPPAAPRTVTYSDALCAKLPPIDVRFEMPADFVSRAPAPAIEAGCLWGTKADLDLVLADPSQGDFTALDRGVLYTRVSTNVVNIPQTGGFDALDGAGEDGMRRLLEAQGATMVVWKKEMLGGLPALQIVADVGGDRVYMLYLGNTHYNTNAILVSYYHPRVRTAADDAVWARFIAGISAAP